MRSWKSRTSSKTPLANLPVIWGYGVDEKLDEDLCVTVIATGFQAQDQLESPAQPRTTVFTLEEEPKEIKAPVQPTQHTQAPPVEALSEEEMPYIKEVEATEEPAPAVTGQLFDLITDEAESAGQKQNPLLRTTLHR